MSKYLVHPASTVGGTIRVPGDKSISHRSLMLGGIADGVTEVRGFLESEDCLSTMKAMQALGVRIERPGAQEVRAHGREVERHRRRCRDREQQLPHETAHGAHWKAAQGNGRKDRNARRQAARAYQGRCAAHGYPL